MSRVSDFAEALRDVIPKDRRTRFEGNSVVYRCSGCGTRVEVGEYPQTMFCKCVRDVGPMRREDKP